MLRQLERWRDSRVHHEFRTIYPKGVAGVCESLVCGSMKECPISSRIFKSFRELKTNHSTLTGALALGSLGMLFVSAGLLGAATPFQVSNRVQVTGKSALFSSPPFVGRYLANQIGGVSGVIVEGPVRTGDNWWWKVDFENGSTGWVLERQLRDDTGQTAGPRLSSTTNSPSTVNTSGLSFTVTPANGCSVTTSRVVLAGNVASDIYTPSLVSFTVNGARVTLDRTGNFSLPVNLHSGVNSFIFRATTPNPRQQTTQISGYLDGSVVYGSDTARAAALRSFQGGKLKTSGVNLLPLNTAGFANANDAHLFLDEELFLAGDVRANENVELSAIQTLFVREHNLLAGAIAAANHNLNDEQIFQMARRLVVAELQVVTYNEFLPALLGPNALRTYCGYNPLVNAGIATEFSTAAFRIGHTLINDDVEFLDNDANDVRDEIELAEAFFNPAPLKEVGPDPVLKYLATDNAQEVDTQLVLGLRNFLFGPPGAGGFDLASLNIQRGRDHGLADYNSTRVAYGLPKVTSFAQITSDPDLQSKLFTLYNNVDSIDLWVGGLAESHVSGASVGPTFRKIMADQFERIRDGDSNWYQRIFSGPQLQALQRTHLSDIIRRNTWITKIQDNVFYFDPAALATMPVKIGTIPAGLINAATPRFAPASLTGMGNNARHPLWATAGFDLMRFAPAGYSDSLSLPAGPFRPSPRLVSNTVSEASAGIPNARLLSDWVYGWGQFLDHDIDLTPSGDDAFDIAVPSGDAYFDPDSTGTALIYFSRSIYDALTGNATPRLQQQTYTITYRGH